MECAAYEGAARYAYNRLGLSSRKTCDAFYKAALYHFSMKQESIGTRIARLLDAKNGGNQSELARFVGVAPQAVQQWIAGRTGPRGGNALRAAEFLGVTQEELLFGVQGGRRRDVLATLGLRQIPFIACAETEWWHAIQAQDRADRFLFTDLDASAQVFALEIRGESMAPLFKEGDCVIIDPAIAPCPGDFVAAKQGDRSVTFKKYRLRGVNEQGDEVFELMPLNADYPSLRSDCLSLAIVGTMLEHRRYRRRDLSDR